ncbi:phosphoribosylamine--glycine ligase [Microlunatus sp. Y2014]|uniref:phosphoribosylamine--glycine ligase n=1 Tax=Microlunatus sp. Y2014 TaxID=3418488 RepID=UPI003DA719C0
MEVLVIGDGGREHALALALSADPIVAAVHAAPGNPGTAQLGTNHPVAAADPAAVAALARELGVGLVVVGPEAPLAAGVADAVRDAGIPCFGPSAAAARIEASKSFAKEVMAAAGVPTGRAITCHDETEVAAALDALGAPHVVKDDGLAAGKGVVVTDDRAVALAHGTACGDVVVEEFLDGPEVSLFAITDGTTVLPLLPAQDFKRVGDGDAGPNTGGMGAYTPLPWLASEVVTQVVDTIIEPTVAEMRRRGTPFAGLLYTGLAITADGPKVIEFNARFGDPETQVLLPLLATPLAQVLLAAATGRLAEVGDLAWRTGSAVAVVLAAHGYPAPPRSGDPITGLDRVGGDAHVIHAGTRRQADGGVVASGGRVLAVVGVGESLTAARDTAYAGMADIHLDGGHHRTDIARTAAEQQSGQES